MWAYNDRLVTFDECSGSVRRKPHLGGVELAHHQIDETMADGPLEAAVTPMNASVRAFEFVRAVAQLVHRFADAVAIRDHHGNLAHPLNPSLQPREFGKIHTYGLGARHVTDRGEISQAKLTTETISFAQFTFQQSK